MKKRQWKCPECGETERRNPRKTLCDHMEVEHGKRWDESNQCYVAAPAKKTNERFAIVPGPEPHVKVVRAFYTEGSWETMRRKWEIHKLEGGFVLVDGLSGKPKHIFQEEDDLVAFLMQTCGTYTKA